MYKHLNWYSFVEKNIFIDRIETPFSIRFLPGAKMLKQYAFLKTGILYNVTDYWENPRGELMIKLLELNYYIKFTKGNIAISNYIIQN
jgi:hypothetical protein